MYALSTKQRTDLHYHIYRCNKLFQQANKAYVTEEHERLKLSKVPGRTFTKRKEWLRQEVKTMRRALDHLKTVESILRLMEIDATSSLKTLEEFDLEDWHACIAGGEQTNHYYEHWLKPVNEWWEENFHDADQFQKLTGYMAASFALGYQGKEPIREILIEAIKVVKSAAMGSARSDTSEEDHRWASHGWREMDHTDDCDGREECEFDCVLRQTSHKRLVKQKGR